MAPERIWKLGAMVRRKSVGGGHRSAVQSAGKKLLVPSPSTFFASKSTYSRFGERIRDGTVWSVCCSASHGAPPCPAICKSGRGHMLPRAQPFVKVGGGTCFPVPYAMESAHALTAIN